MSTVTPPGGDGHPSARAASTSERSSERERSTTEPSEDGSVESGAAALGPGAAGATGDDGGTDVPAAPAGGVDEPSGLYPAHPGLSGLSAAPATPTRPNQGPAERHMPAAGPAQDDTGQTLMERRRITPRSPRAALEPERVPVPTRRSKRARHPLVRAGNAILSFIVLVTIAAGVTLFVGKQRFETAGPLEQDRIVNIPRGYGVRDIAELLVREGVIDQPWTFVAGVIVMKAREGLKSGEYRFAKRASLQDVVDTITEGKVVQHDITVPEGLTSEQIVARLMENPTLSGDIKDIPREGTLLPETYKFTRGTSRAQIVQRMQQAQRRFVNEIWERRLPDLPISTPEELVILASIIEKETSHPDERTRVAAVFVNRLRQKMKLQSDPTIIYGLVGGKGALGHPITKSERDQPTAYNTYTIDGLPPGPIANPGRASLEAAANPARTRELYFVADGTGGHTFSDNYEQHLKAVARLRAHERQQNAEQTEPPQQPAAAEPERSQPPAPVPRPRRR